MVKVFNPLFIVYLSLYIEPECLILTGSSTTNEDLDNVYRLLENEQRPLTPDHTCPQSQEIFEEHKQLAHEYFKVQTEIALLSQQKNTLMKNLSIESLKQQEELRELENEKVIRNLFRLFHDTYSSSIFKKFILKIQS